MKITNTIKVMKQINPEVIILLKVGEFYYQYGKDSYIISYLFSYKLKNIENNIPFSGFPKSALYKVLTKLEEQELSYIIVDKSLNYEVIEKEIFKSNKYKEFLSESFNSKNFLYNLLINITRVHYIYIHTRKMSKNANKTIKIKVKRY